MSNFIDAFLKNFRFDPVKAAAARAQSSASPTAQAIGAAATAAIVNIATDGAAAIQSHNSTLGVINPLIGDAETGIKTVLDTLITAAFGEVPLVGGALGSASVNLANAFLDTQEQHLLTYVAAHFGNVRAAVNTPAQAGTSFGA